MIKKVLVTLDGSTFSEAVLPYAAELTLGTEAEIHLLRVADEPKGTSAYTEKEPLTTGVPAPGGIVTIAASPRVETATQAVDRTAGELSEFLADKAELFRRSGTRCQAIVRFGDTAPEIVLYAQKEKIDLIMMATHGHSGLARVIFGSVASRVVASGVCPVMLVRPADLKEG